MPRARRDIDASLTTKGFRLAIHGDHDRYWLFIGERKQQVFTKMSRGTSHRTISDDLVGEMAKQIRLSRKEFLQLVDCTLSGSDYIQLLRSRNIPLRES